MTQLVQFEDLGNMPYKQAWDYQEILLKKNLDVKAELRLVADSREPIVDSVLHSPLTTHHYLLFVEHPPVYTLGKSGHIENILISDEERAAKGIEYYPTNRGGDITFHGPQQIVGYPILDLEKFETDIGKYLRKLEHVIILTMADYGLKGERSKGETGVWLEPDIKGKERKICAMGVRCSRWITMHGFAFNVNTDLNYFNYIIPCGIENKQVTSLEKELGHKVDFEEAKESVKRNFEKVFDVKL
ncbi:lipoyl(octanoyl) transferase LipB [Lacibacter sp.]|uniref:lipoyl(octanoyl) transferase LipB n=1 Tax=Lacibacter sp. TaxID=1915409 RepID=UPI002B4B17A9|nr:lipoyl(octanoyl) transferase LipB [Lacibacter sp.]HLP36676.1 lipoyl(octanoyl) transferase LipB [Lacibacter sp.]